jgi:hypothetical protein
MHADRKYTCHFHCPSIRMDDDNIALVFDDMNIICLISKVRLALL